MQLSLDTNAGLDAFEDGLAYNREAWHVRHSRTSGTDPIAYLGDTGDPAVQAKVVQAHHNLGEDELLDLVLAGFVTDEVAGEGRW